VIEKKLEESEKKMYQIGENICKVYIFEGTNIMNVKRMPATEKQNNTQFNFKRTKYMSVRFSMEDIHKWSMST
jgi:hypothetical protein